MTSANDDGVIFSQVIEGIYSIAGAGALSELKMLEWRFDIGCRNVTERSVEVEIRELFDDDG